MKYNNEPTLIPANDDKGHNVQLSIRVPPDWVRQIDTIVKYKQFPYCNRGDLIRDAIYRHFGWLEQQQDEDIPGSLFHQIQVILDMFEETRRQQGFENVLTALEERVLYFTKEGAPTEAIKYVLRVLGYIDEMPEGHWKDKFAAKVKERYAGLLKGATKAKLKAT